MLVCVSGVSADEVKTISVKEGESVTLDPDDAKTTSDVITWFFDGTRITKITGDPNQISTDLQTNEKFKDRLTVNQNGSLTMMNTRITDSGLYKLQISSSSDGFSITRMKIFRVSVIGVYFLVIQCILVLCQPKCLVVDRLKKASITL